MPFEGEVEDDDAELSSWQIENKKNKRTIGEWVATSPRPRLIIMSIILGPQLRLLLSYLEMAGVQWDEDQLFQQMQTGERKYRIVEAYTQGLTLKAFEDLRALLVDGTVWEVLGGDLNRHHLTLAFRMISRVLGGLHMLLYDRHAGYPYKLFGIIQDPTLADEIIADGHCRWCPFTAGFLAKHNTANKLQSDEARLALLAIAATARRDTSRIECRFASVRRMKLIKSLTHLQSLEASSSLFVLRRQRVLEKASWAGSQSRPPEESAQNRPASKRPKVEGGGRRCSTHGGGGPYRAFMSERFRQDPSLRDKGHWNLEELAKASAEYHAIKEENGEGFARLCTIGIRATEARQQTGKSGFCRSGAGHLDPRVAQAVARLYDPSVGVEPDADNLALAFVGQSAVLCDKLRELARQSRGKSTAERLRFSQQQHALVEWSKRQLVHGGLPSIAHCLEPSAAQLHSIAVQIPAIELVKLLSHGPPQFHAAVRRQWKKDHLLLRHSDVPAITALGSGPSRCCLAGQCLCSGGGKIIDNFLVRLKAVMRSLCAKDKPLNAALCEGTLVLQLVSSTLESIWLQAAFANMTSFNISFVKLVEVEDAMLRRVATEFGLRMLHCVLDDETLGLTSIAQCGASLDLYLAWDLKLWVLEEDRGGTSPGVPGYLMVKPAHAQAAEAQLWDGSSHRKTAARKSRRRRRAPFGFPEAEPLPLAGHAEAQVGDVGGHASSEEDAWDEDGAGVAEVGDICEEFAPDEFDEIDDVWRALDFQNLDIGPMAEDAGDDPFAEPFPLHGNGEPDEPHRGHEDEVRADNGGSDTEQPPLAPPPGPAPPLPMLPAVGPMRVGPWWQFVLPDGLGKLVYNHDAGSLDAHCTLHKQCRMNRSLSSSSSRASQGRPVGSLVAWLRVGNLFDSKSTHAGAKKDEAYVSYGHRDRARAWASELPGFDQVLSLERARRPGERAEPITLPG